MRRLVLVNRLEKKVKRAESSETENELKAMIRRSKYSKAKFVGMKYELKGIQSAKWRQAYENTSEECRGI